MATHRQHDVSDRRGEPPPIWLGLWSGITISICLSAVLFVRGEGESRLADALTVGLAVLQNVLAGTSVWVAMRGTVGFRRSPRARRQKLRLRAASGVLVLVSLCTVYFLVIRKPDLPVTSELSHAELVDLRNGESVTLRVPGNPPARRHLRFTLRLDNPSDVGDCARSAALDLTLLRDGDARAARNGVRSGEVVEFDLKDTAVHAAIAVMVRLQDDRCVVNLRAEHAVLHN